ncbi:MAG TPA: hypothetical protein DCP69_04150 [Candidatus Omnitrophica bacterium]|nr:hypothetical protein [Candidatus Omnitrophota bacterium]
MAGTVQVTIKPPNMEFVEFRIMGTAPLVIHRFDEKIKREFGDKIVRGTSPAGKKRHEPRTLEDLCEAAKYIGETNGERWEGFNAGAIRAAMISACRVVNFKMTLAKLSLFVVQDSWDVKDPLIPLIRIYGASRISESIGRTSTDVAMLTVRPMYFPWEANIRIRFDGDQFNFTDVANLLQRVGEQVGIGEGRPDSKNSAGMGWGTFELKR